MSVVMMLLFSHRRAEMEHERGDAGDRPRIERQQRRLAGAAHRHRAAAALRDLQAMAVAEVLQAEIEFPQVARGDRADIGVERGGRGALVLAPFRRDVGRAGDEHVFRDFLDERLALCCSCTGFRNDHRKQIAIACTPSATRRRIAASASFSFSGTDDLAEAIHPLGDAADRGAWARSASGFELSGNAPPCGCRGR